MICACKAGRGDYELDMLWLGRRRLSIVHVASQVDEEELAIVWPSSVLPLKAV